jgi:hypothetical protein
MPVTQRVAMFVNPGFSVLLRIFNANNLRYMVIGGYPPIQHAGPRFTKDLDRWIRSDMLDSVPVYQSSMQFGAPLAITPETEFFQKTRFLEDHHA